MHITESCVTCLYNRQAQRVNHCQDSTKKAAFLSEIKTALDERAADACSPYMVYVFNQIYAKYFEITDEYSDIKKEYNTLVMSLEDKIEEKINASSNPLETAAIYARTGNYIDYGAVRDVDHETFLSLLDESRKLGLDTQVWQSFCRKCENGSHFLLLCDNCGEIVLDKLFIRQLKKSFAHLEISAMVRGGNVLNDATLEDAAYCGMAEEASVIPSGIALAGTIPDMLAPNALKVLQNANVILAKGQGNYESMAGNGIPAFYSFLCKCDLFISRFQVPRFTGMFIEES